MNFLADLAHIPLDTAPEILMVLAVLAIERAFPVEKNQPWRHVLYNLGIYLSAVVVTSSLVFRFIEGLKSSLVAAFGGPLIVIPNAVTLSGKLIHFIAYLFIWDFFNYWFHRLQHSNRLMWATHKLHHDDSCFNASTALRAHWLTHCFSVALLSFPMALVFHIAPTLRMYNLIYIGFIIFTHMNIRFELGKLTPFLCGPQLHRIHHSIEREHWNKNFAAFFPFWDIVFGTYYHPKRGEFPSTGLSDSPMKDKFWSDTFEPFQIWKKLIK